MNAAELAAPRTVGEMRRDLAGRLRRAGRGESAALDARMILAHAMKIDAGSLPLIDDRPLSAEAIARAERLIARRMAGEPVARIIGAWEFWSLPFLLSPETLVPRPDSETLVAAVLTAITAAGRREEPLRLLDLGTGSGCLLLALLSELPGATGIGVDRAQEAVATAQHNAERLGLGSRARFVAGNWADGLTGRFDVIVSNPPYVRAGEMAELAIEVRGHDPLLALVGGADGLDCYRAIVPQLPRLMADGAMAALEFGPGQARPIERLAEEAGLGAAIERDLAGRERVALLRINSSDERSGQKALGKSGWRH